MAPGDHLVVTLGLASGTPAGPHRRGGHSGYTARRGGAQEVCTMARRAEAAAVDADGESPVGVVGDGWSPHPSVRAPTRTAGLRWKERRMGPSRG
jgi:hypothetical protein